MDFLHSAFDRWPKNSQKSFFMHRLSFSCGTVQCSLESGFLWLYSILEYSSIDQKQFLLFTHSTLFLPLAPPETADVCSLSQVSPLPICDIIMIILWKLPCFINVPPFGWDLTWFQVWEIMYEPGIDICIQIWGCFHFLVIMNKLI